MESFCTSITCWYQHPTKNLLQLFKNNDVNNIKPQYERIGCREATFKLSLALNCCSRLVNIGAWWVSSRFEVIKIQISFLYRPRAGNVKLKEPTSAFQGSEIIFEPNSLLYEFLVSRIFCGLFVIRSANIIFLICLIVNFCGRVHQTKLIKLKENQFICRESCQSSVGYL